MVLESLQEQNLFEIEMSLFFAVTFYQLNASLLNVYTHTYVYCIICEYVSMGIYTWSTHWNLQDCGMLDSEDPVPSNKGWGMGHFPCICTGLGLKYTAVKETQNKTNDDWRDLKTFQIPKEIFTCLCTLSNISKSLALGWWIVQMMVRPPCARDFIKDTTWKQDALSKPLKSKSNI